MNEDNLPLRASISVRVANCLDHLLWITQNMEVIRPIKKQYKDDIKVLILLGIVQGQELKLQIGWTEVSYKVKRKLQIANKQCLSIVLLLVGGALVKDLAHHLPIPPLIAVQLTTTVLQPPASAPEAFVAPVCFTGGLIGAFMSARVRLHPDTNAKVNRPKTTTVVMCFNFFIMLCCDMLLCLRSSLT